MTQLYGIKIKRTRQEAVEHLFSTEKERDDVFDSIFKKVEEKGTALKYRSFYTSLVTFTTEKHGITIQKFHYNSSANGKKAQELHPMIADLFKD